VKFVHTADWQLGKPFAAISDPRKRSLVQYARIEVISRISRVAKDAAAELVLVAGDLFDSPSADKATVSVACSAIGQMQLPVIVIPGNHDHGGPGSLWEQEFFQRKQTALAPNLIVLRETVPFEVESAVILPCPLLRRAVSTDPTAWLRGSDVYNDLPSDKPHIVLAHGSTQTFLGQWDDDEEGSSSTNLIDLARVPAAEVDYIALGDWHGTKQMSQKAWYAGTPEPDRFPKGADYDSGNILVVDVRRGSIPEITKTPSGGLRWSELSHDFAHDNALDTLAGHLDALVGRRANEDLLRLTNTVRHIYCLFSQYCSSFPVKRS
jgi:DNA repair exonuclease SbcCD nuclease subunit